MAFNYYEDHYGKECLEMAKQCHTDVGFGAVLVKNGKIVGRGRNRRATSTDREMISHTDYAIHAEQDAILQALLKGINVEGLQIYVLGMSLMGSTKGLLTARSERIFVCRKCPHVFMKYNISVNIPHLTGWMNISAPEAMEIGRRVSDKGYWKDFVEKGIV